MKKLTLILLLIPILNNGQLLSDLCRINSNDFFKKTATELNYEKVIENDDYTSYALEFAPIETDVFIYNVKFSLEEFKN